MALNNNNTQNISSNNNADYSGMLLLLKLTHALFFLSLYKLNFIKILFLTCPILISYF